MSSSIFGSLNRVIQRRHRWVIIGWAIAVIASLLLVPSFFASISYDILGGGGGPSNSQSQKASDTLKTQFPSSTNSSSASIILVVDGVQAYSEVLKNSIHELNATISGDSRVSNYSDISSVYTLEYGVLNSSLPSILPGLEALEANIWTINSGVYILADNLSSLSSSLFQIVQGVNQTSQLIYGVPSTFVNVWEGVVAQNVTDPYVANLQANSTVYQVTGNFGGNNESLAYYNLFFNVWNSTFETIPFNTTSDIEREQVSVDQSVAVFLNSSALDAQTAQMVDAVRLGLNATTWNQEAAIVPLAVSTLASNIPPDLSSSLNVSPTVLLNQLYNLGPSPSQSQLVNYSLILMGSTFSGLGDLGSGFSLSELLSSAANLGSSPTFAQVRALAAQFISSGTQSSFLGSPLYSVNSTSFANFLSSLPQNATASDIESAIQNEISNHSFSSYPYLPTAALTGNFVSKSNSTSLIILSFSSTPDVNTIKAIRSDVEFSTLNSQGKTYVTGSPVLMHDVEDAFAPALEVTVGPSIAVSLIIAAILFLAPLAALIPVIIGGISTVIALAAIYLGIVKIGGGNLTFLTPALTVFLLLGLAVDYAVLQLRRTKEERLKGKSIEESVGVSVRWAGQAVLTAGITVIAAYIVMAVVNVPVFSDVGAAIAIGVSVLLFASLTLLPALEIALGDKIFWPGLKRNQRIKNPIGESKLRRLVSGTLRRKILVVSVICVIAAGAFYVEYTTPAGEDFLKLIPNFQSNQGLTVISNSFGGGTVAPTTIVVTTSTEMVSHDQFNQTLLDQLEMITDAAANTQNVASVVGPTRPFGSAFNYSAVQNMSSILASQYQSQMLSMIGKDNKTAIITVGFSTPGQSQTTVNSLLQMQKNIHNLPLINEVTVNYAGETQSTYDGQSFISGLIPEVVVILSVAVYVILFLQLKSAFTPVRLIFTILCSVVFSLAILSLVFYRALDLPILNFVPLFVVVTMLGVGIDYDIFLVTRIREEVLSGKTDDEAIKTAVDRVWVTILGLGLVLSTVFASLMITGIPILQEISLAVSAAILIDVVVVILFFVPSLMGLAQKLNWWPYKLAKTKQDDQKN